MWPASSPLQLRDKTEPEIKPRVTALNLTENTLPSASADSCRADLHVSVIFSKNTSFGSYQKYVLVCFIWWSLFAIWTNDTLGYTWLWELGNSISSPDITNYYEMFILRILKPTTLFMTEFHIPYLRFCVFLVLVSSIIIRLREWVERVTWRIIWRSMLCFIYLYFPQSQVSIDLPGVFALLLKLGEIYGTLHFHDMVFPLPVKTSRILTVVQHRPKRGVIMQISD